ncbi:MAG: mechanosensitive ion channel family protein, partial [Anaerolineales bacterium]
MPWDPNFWAETLSQITSDVVAWLPNLGVALLLVLAGWIIARLVQAIMAGLLRRLGVDRLAERAGANELLNNIGFGYSTVDMLARLVFWLILLVFLLAATESLGLSGVVEALAGLIDYLPNVLASALILLFGGLLAQVLGDAVSALTVQSGLAGGAALGRVVRYAVFAFAIILALQQLGVETTLLTITTLALIGAIALALAVAFGLGSQQLARNIMAGFHVREEFIISQRLTIGEVQGTLAHIGNAKS